MISSINILLIYPLSFSIPITIISLSLHKKLHSISEKKAVFFYFVACFVSFCALDLFVGEGCFKTILQVIIIFLFLKCVIKDDKVYYFCFFTACIQYLLCEIIVLLQESCNLLFLDYIDYETTKNIFLIFYIYVINIIIYILNRKSKITSIANWFHRHDFSIFIFLLIALLFQQIQLFLFVQPKFLLGNSLIKILICSLVQIVSISFFIFCEVHQISVSYRNNRELLHYQHIIVNQYDTTRMFRHDYKNQLIALKGYYDLKDLDNLGIMLNDLYSEMADSYRSPYISSIESIKDPGLRFLLINKVLSAESKDVKFSINVKNDFICNTVKSTDMVAILGNTIDNAIDAASEALEKLVVLLINCDSENTTVQISNTFKQPPDIHSIFEKNYSTKNKHSGLGLYKVKKTLMKYKTISFDVCIENDFFVLKMYL